jgi:hypothetical protein
LWITFHSAESPPISHASSHGQYHPQPHHTREMVKLYIATSKSPRPPPHLCPSSVVLTAHLLHRSSLGRQHESRITLDSSTLQSCHYPRYPQFAFNTKLCMHRDSHCHEWRKRDDSIAAIGCTKSYVVENLTQLYRTTTSSGTGIQTSSSSCHSKPSK